MFDSFDEIIHPRSFCLQDGVALAVAIPNELEDAGSEELDYGKVGTASMMRLNDEIEVTIEVWTHRYSAVRIA